PAACAVSAPPSRAWRRHLHPRPGSSVTCWWPLPLRHLSIILACALRLIGKTSFLSRLRLLYQRAIYTPTSECKLRGDRFRSPCCAKCYRRALQSLRLKNSCVPMNASATRTGRNWCPNPIQTLLATGLFASLGVTLVLLIQGIHPAPDKLTLQKDASELASLAKQSRMDDSHI